MKINWEAVEYSLEKAKKDFESLEVHDKNVGPIQIDSEWGELRKKLIQARDEVFDKLGLDEASSLSYSFDLEFGLKLYEVLNESIGFDNRVASNVDVWRYLSIKVIPDIVHSRRGLNEQYYYLKPVRIWLYAIWWYINLSWMGDEERTRDVIQHNTTDTIVGIVERPGIGYYIDVNREIMKQNKDYSDEATLRKVLKLNTARIMVISPELVVGGVEGYVNDLFESVGAKKKRSIGGYVKDLFGVKRK